jgi:hypothetical protein
MYHIQVICVLLVLKKIREYAELGIEMKHQWQLEAVCTLTATISAAVILHKLHDVLHDHITICSL